MDFPIEPLIFPVDRAYTILDKFNNSEGDNIANALCVSLATCPKLRTLFCKSFCSAFISEWLAPFAIASIKAYPCASSIPESVPSPASPSNNPPRTKLNANVAGLLSILAAPPSNRLVVPVVLLAPYSANHWSCPSVLRRSTALITLLKLLPRGTRGPLFTFAAVLVTSTGDIGVILAVSTAIFPPPSNCN